MKMVSISVTDAARNFSDCINRVRYQGMTFILEKNGVPVARIVPAERKVTKGSELAVRLRDALKDVHLGTEEAATWANELEAARSRLNLVPPEDRWQS